MREDPSCNGHQHKSYWVAVEEACFWRSWKLLIASQTRHSPGSIEFNSHTVRCKTFNTNFNYRSSRGRTVKIAFRHMPLVKAVSVNRTTVKERNEPMMNFRKQTKNRSFHGSSSHEWNCASVAKSWSNGYNFVPTKTRTVCNGRQMSTTLSRTENWLCWSTNYSTPRTWLMGLEIFNGQ